MEIQLVTALSLLILLALIVMVLPSLISLCGNALLRDLYCKRYFIDLSIDYLSMFLAILVFLFIQGVFGPRGCKILHTVAQKHRPIDPQKRLLAHLYRRILFLEWRDPDSSHTTATVVQTTPVILPETPPTLPIIPLPPPPIFSKPPPTTPPSRFLSRTPLGSTPSNSKSSTLTSSPTSLRSSVPSRNESWKHSTATSPPSPNVIAQQEHRKFVSDERRKRWHAIREERLRNEKEKAEEETRKALIEKAQLQAVLDTVTDRLGKLQREHQKLQTENLKLRNSRVRAEKAANRENKPASKRCESNKPSSGKPSLDRPASSKPECKQSAGKEPSRRTKTSKQASEAEADGEAQLQDQLRIHFRTVAGKPKKFRSKAYERFSSRNTAKKAGYRVNKPTFTKHASNKPVARKPALSRFASYRLASYKPECKKHAQKKRGRRTKTPEQASSAAQPAIVDHFQQPTSVETVIDSPSEKVCIATEETATQTNATNGNNDDFPLVEQTNITQPLPAKSDIQQTITVETALPTEDGNLGTVNPDMLVTLPRPAPRHAPMSPEDLAENVIVITSRFQSLSSITGYRQVPRRYLFDIEWIEQYLSGIGRFSAPPPYQAPSTNSAATVTPMDVDQVITHQTGLSGSAESIGLSHLTTDTEMVDSMNTSDFSIPQTVAAVEGQPHQNISPPLPVSPINTFSSSPTQDSSADVDMEVHKECTPAPHQLHPVQMTPDVEVVMNDATPIPVSSSDTQTVCDMPDVVEPVATTVTPAPTVDQALTSAFSAMLLGVRSTTDAVMGARQDTAPVSNTVRSHASNVKKPMECRPILGSSTVSPLYKTTTPHTASASSMPVKFQGTATSSKIQASVQNETHHDTTSQLPTPISNDLPCIQYDERWVAAASFGQVVDEIEKIKNALYQQTPLTPGATLGLIRRLNRLVHKVAEKMRTDGAWFFSREVQAVWNVSNLERILRRLAGRLQVIHYRNTSNDVVGLMKVIRQEIHPKMLVLSTPLHATPFTSVGSSSADGDDNLKKLRRLRPCLFGRPRRPVRDFPVAFKRGPDSQDVDGVGRRFVRFIDDSPRIQALRRGEIPPVDNSELPYQGRNDLMRVEKGHEWIAKKFAAQMEQIKITNDRLKKNEPITFEGKKKRVMFITSFVRRFVEKLRADPIGLRQVMSVEQIQDLQVQLYELRANLLSHSENDKFYKPAHEDVKQLQRAVFSLGRYRLEDVRLMGYRPV